MIEVIALAVALVFIAGSVAISGWLNREISAPDERGDR